LFQYRQIIPILTAEKLSSPPALWSIQEHMRHLPPLSALPAFEATARLGSVTAAAAELGRTHSAISKQLRHLGEDLGGALFEKDGTGLRLTQRGAQLQAELRPMLDRLDHVAQQLRQQQDQRRVRLAVSATFATRWLTPRLPRFYAQHPDVEVDLLMSGPHRDMRDTYDLILSYDRLRGPLRETRKPEILGDTSYGPVCAPGYPLVQSPEGWRAELRLVHAGAPQSWDAWRRLSGVALRAARDSAYPHHILALEAAAAGLGVAVAERRLVADDLASGRLIAPLGFVRVSNGLQAIVTPAGETSGQHKHAVRAVLDWLRASITEENAQD